MGGGPTVVVSVGGSCIVCTPLLDLNADIMMVTLTLEPSCKIGERTYPKDKVTGMPPRLFYIHTIVPLLYFSSPEIPCILPCIKVEDRAY